MAGTEYTAFKNLKVRVRKRARKSCEPDINTMAGVQKPDHHTYRQLTVKGNMCFTLR